MLNILLLRNNEQVVISAPGKKSTAVYILWECSTRFPEGGCEHRSRNKREIWDKVNIYMRFEGSRVKEIIQNKLERC